jgi:hypothetical protein
VKRLSHAVVFALVALVPLAWRTTAVAEEVKPIAVVSVASVKESLTDLGYLTTVAGMEGAGRSVRLLGSALTTGMDKTRPSGMYIVPHAGDFHGVAFLPVTDLPTLLEIHAEYIGEAHKGDDGIYEVGMGRTFYIKEQNGWAFVGETKDHLKNLPADPSIYLGDLPKRYNVAARLIIQNIPPELRNMAIDEIKFGIERGLDSPALERRRVDRATAQQAAHSVLQNIEDFLNEAEEVSFGWSVEPDTKKTYIDLNLVAKAGTKLAREMAVKSETKTAFGGFRLPGASVTVNVSTQLSEQEASQIKGILASIHNRLGKRIDDDPNLARDHRAPAKEVLSQLFRILDDTVTAGKLDGGGALVLEPQSINLVAGGSVTDGLALEATIKKIVELARNEPDFPQVQLNAAKHAGVNLHRIAYPIPAREVEMREFFGDKFELVLGTGEKSLYLATGKNAESLLKGAIDQSAAEAGKPIEPLQINVALQPLMKFFASVDDNPVLPGLAGALERSGNDKVIITSRSTPNGSGLRIEVQEGLLRLIGESLKRFSQDLESFL